MNPERAEQADRFIVDYLQEHAYPPSVRELADHLQVTKSTAHRVLTELVLLGWYERDGNRPRALRRVRP